MQGIVSCACGEQLWWHAPHARSATGGVPLMRAGGGGENWRAAQLVAGVLGSHVPATQPSAVWCAVVVVRGMPGHTPLAVRASQETPTCSRACAGVQLMGSGPQIRHHTVAHSTTIDEHCRPLPVGARRWRLRSDLAGCSVLQLFCPATSVPVQRGSHSTARRSSARQPGSGSSLVLVVTQEGGVLSSDSPLSSTR